MKRNKFGMKKGIHIGASKYPIIEVLSDAQAGKLFKALILEDKGEDTSKFPKQIREALIQFQRVQKPKELIPSKEKIPDSLESEVKGFLGWIVQVMGYSSEVVKMRTSAEKQKSYSDLWRKLRLNYEKEEIKQSILFAVNDEFWRKNFLSPLKLLRTNKEGLKYIDYFISQSNIIKHEQRKKEAASTEGLIT